MFRRVNIQLTFLLTFICSLILIIMSVCYMLIYRKSIYEGSFTRFSMDVNSFCNELSGNNIISYDAIYELQRNFDYNLFIYDNDQPIRFTAETKTDDEKAMVEEVKQFCFEDINALRFSGRLNHIEDFCKIQKQTLVVGIINIPGKNGSTEVVIINGLSNENAQIRDIALKFVIIILVTVSVLFVFSYFFTKKLLRPIRKSNEQQTLFIAAASHEIRNPVNTIMFALDAMDKSDGEEKSKFAAIAKKEGKRLAFLTKDLLTLARSDNKSFQVECKPTELDTLILDCYEASIAPAAEKKISVKITLPEDTVPAVSVDPNRIKQVVSIILSNAVSYTPESGVIEIEYSVTASHHRITISDSGLGISDEDKQHIFERFYRCDRSREDRSHFGLGLAIAMEIITLHKGKITVTDSPLGGASFTITLPV